MKRRTFLTSTLVASVGLFLNKLGIATPVENPVFNSPTLIKKKPVVISTWTHGLEANKAAWKVLASHGSALDAAEIGVKVTEADAENRSVGIGGYPDAEGNVTLDACIMNHKSECGAVACLQHFAHPISVARKVMENSPHVFLVSRGAEEFALANGFTKTNLLTKQSKLDWEKWKKSKSMSKPLINHENHDTIGMLVLDAEGNLSGACTTSGWAYKLPGRVGDSPIIGAGLFVDNEVGAACATGIGEAVIRIAGSHTVVELMRQGKSPTEACKLAVERLLSKHSNHENLQVGFIALNKNGESGAYSTISGFNYALREENKETLIDAPYIIEQ